MGISAFPHPEMEIWGPVGDAGPITASAQVGLTKRELFAAMAMQGLLANPGNAFPRAAVKRIAVEQANQLLAELETNFEQDGAAARDLIHIGASVPPHDVSAERLAALTGTISTIFNLDEAKYK